MFSFTLKITNSNMMNRSPVNAGLVKTRANVKTSLNKMWSLEGWAAWRWRMMIGFSWHGSAVNISTGVGLKGHPSFCGDRKTNRLTLSCEWLSYIYLIIIELLGTGTPSAGVSLPAFPLSRGPRDQTRRQQMRASSCVWNPNEKFVSPVWTQVSSN